MKDSRYSVKTLCVTALLMAINIVMSSFGVPVPGGRMYLNDVIVCIGGILLDPFEAFMVGGVGAFIGDLLFYPAPMFVSLAVHGLQAVVISLFSRKKDGRRMLRSCIGTAIGAVIMIVGYTLGRAYVYSTPAYAVMKLPFQILQAVAGGVIALILCWKAGLVNLYERFIERKN